MGSKVQVFLGPLGPYPENRIVERSTSKRIDRAAVQAAAWKRCANSLESSVYAETASAYMRDKRLGLFSDTSRERNVDKNDLDLTPCRSVPREGSEPVLVVKLLRAFGGCLGTKRR